MRLAGRVAVVTGAAHGIGKAYTQRLAADGAAVAIVDVDKAAADAVAAELTAGGHKAMAVAADVSDKAATEAMAQAVAGAYGRIDALVNNAAMFSVVPMSRVPFEEIDPVEWDRLMAVNLRGPWLTCRAVVPYMRKNGYGKIVNIGSSTVWERSPSRIHYVTSKAGIVGFTRTLAVELGKDGITVNCVCPGSTLSEEHPTPEMLKFRTETASARALKRIQKPEDLAGAISFFCSPDSDFITGQTLLVDGGAAMH